MANGNNDTRIVQMQFDNKDFEKNIAKSQKSLEKFKKDLNFEEASKGVDKFSKSVKDMDGFEALANNVQKLTDKFTGLGKASEFVASRIRRTLEDMGDRVISFANSLTTVQQQAGFVKYESLNKSVQTLRSATHKEEVEIYGVLERLTKYTDETSYDFAQGVTSISQLVSSGAASLSEAEKVVEGFYNYAAKAGADTQKASMALQYSMVQAMQRGYLDWSNAKELSSKSLLTSDFKEQLLETAIALGTVTKEGGKYYAVSKKGSKKKKVEINTTDKFNDSLQHQWVTTKVLNATLEKYADTTTEFGAEAFAAAQRCTTFTDALNAWKDMLATGWMQTYRTVFGDLSDAMELFSGICNKVSNALAELSDARNRVLKSWKGLGGKDSLWAMLVGEFESPDGQIINEGKRGMLDVIFGLGDTISGAFWDMVKNSMSEADRSQLEMWAGNTDAVLRMMEAEGLLDGATEEELAELRSYIEENFGERSLLQAYLGSRLAEATKSIQEFVQKVHEWMNAVDETTGKTRLQQLQGTISGIFSAMKTGVKVIGGAFHFLFLIASQLSPSFKAIFSLFEKLGKFLTKASQDADASGGIVKFFEKLANALKPITDAINNVVIGLVDMIGSFVEWGESTGTFATIWETITKAMSAFGGVIVKIAKPVLDFITNFFSIITELFTKGINKETLKNAGESLKQAFLGMFEGFSNISPEAFEAIGDFFHRIFDSAKNFIKDETGRSDIFSNLLSWFRKGFARFSEVLKELSLSFAQNKNVVTVFDGIKIVIDELKQLFIKFRDFFGMSNTEAALVIASVVGLVILIVQITKAVRRLGDGMRSLGGAIKRFSLIGNEKTETPGDKFLKIAASLAIISAAVYVFGNMPWQKALQGMAAMGLILLGMGLFIKSLSKSIQNLDWKTTGAIAIAMISLGIAISKMIPMMEMLGKMNSESYGRALIGLVSVMAAIAGFFYAVGKLDIDFKKVSGMLPLAISIWLLVKVLLKIADMPKDKLETMGEALVAIMGALAVVGFAVRKAAKGTFRDIGLMVAAISLLIFSLKSLANMNDSQFIQMAKGFGGLIAGLLILTAGIALINRKIGGINGTGLKELAFAALAMGILVYALKPVADMGNGKLLQMGKAFAGLIAGLLILTGGLAAINNKTIGLKGSGLGSLLVAALGMWAIIMALKPVADMKDVQLVKMGATFYALISGILILVGGLRLIESKLGGGMKKSISFGALLALVLGMIGIIEVLKPIGDMDDKKLTKMGMAFSALVLGLSLAVGLIQATASNFGKAIGSILIILGFVLAMAHVIRLMLPLGEIADDKLIKVGIIFGSFIVGMLALVGSIALIGKIPIGAVMKGLLVLGIAVAGLIGVLFLIGKLVALAVSSLLDSVKPIVDKMVMIAGSISDFSSAMSDIGQEGLNSAGDKIAKMMEIIKSLSGAGSYYQDIFSFADQLLLLGTGAGLFQFATNGVQDPESSNAFKMIHALLDLSESLKTFSGFGAAVDFFALGESLALFDTATNGITTDEPPALKLLGKLAEASGGLASLSTLDTSTLQDNLAGLGGALSLYAMGAKEAGGLTDAEVPDVSKAVDLIRGVITSLDKDGGITLPDLPESGSLSMFGVQLAALANALTLFANSTQDLDEDKSKNALKVLDFMSNLKSKLTADTLGVVTALGKEGVNLVSLTRFGLEISALGTALSRFKDSTSDLGDMSTAEDALTFFEGLKSRLEAAKLKETIHYFDDNKVDVGALDAFGLQIAALGTSLASFATNVNFSRDADGNIITDKVNDFTAALSALDDLSKFQARLPVVGGVIQWFTGENMNFSRFASNIGDLGRGLAEFSGHISAVDENGLKKFDAAGVADALSSIEALTGIVTNLYNTPENFTTNGYTYASTLADFIDGLIGYEQLPEQIASIVKDISTALSADGNYDYTTFNTVGENISNGIAVGIGNAVGVVEAAARAVVRAAVVAANQEADSHSPSRVFAVVGGYMSQGMALGLRDGSTEVEKAASVVVDSAVDSASQAMATFAALMSQEIDANPVITPVLDLSNIQTGAGFINGVLSGARGISLSAGAGGNYAQTSVPRSGRSTGEYQGTDLSGINSRLNSLSAQLNNLGNQIGNLQIVMDSGAVVGSISPGVSRNIGQKSTFNRRHNA